MLFKNIFYKTKNIRTSIYLNVTQFLDVITLLYCSLLVHQLLASVRSWTSTCFVFVIVIVHNQQISKIVWTLKPRAENL